jgi:hypothetical protein
MAPPFIKEELFPFPKSQLYTAFVEAPVVLFVNVTATGEQPPGLSITKSAFAWE